MTRPRRRRTRPARTPGPDRTPPLHQQDRGAAGTVHARAQHAGETQPPPASPLTERPGQPLEPHAPRAAATGNGGPATLAGEQLVPEWTPDLPGVRAARHVAAAAERAARAWQQCDGQDEITATAGHLLDVFAGVAAALRAMADYETVSSPGGARYTSPWEPCTWLHCAARVIGYAASDMREAGWTPPAAGEPRWPAAEAGAQLAAAAAGAPDLIGRPRGSAHARDASVTAFIHLTGILGAAAGTLARHDGGQLAAILTRQQVRLEQAGICLREALITSACSADDAASLATARAVRSRHLDRHDRCLPPQPKPAQVKADGHDQALEEGNQLDEYQP